jgi:putative Mn2+ efflux pump MntP
MGLIEILLIAASLSMDAFAVSISKGLEMKKAGRKEALLIAVFFGCFQAGMPVFGWLFGMQFERYIMDYGHWAAFILLSAIGGKMILDVVKKDKDGGEQREREKTLSIRKLLLLAVATSIDALAVGVSFAFLESPVFPAVLVIGLITFILSFIGVLLGNGCGNRFGGKAELFGGIILILIGLKILFEHLVYPGF